MTKEELKKKICEIIAPYVSAWGEDERIADAIIAAGYGKLSEHRVFVSKDNKEIKQLYRGEEVEKIVKERDEYKHHAEVTERIAKNACAIVFTREIDEEEWAKVIVQYKEEHGLFDEAGITDNMLYDYLKERAEKDLAEEKNGRTD